MTDLRCSFTGHRQLGSDFDLKLLEKVIFNLIKHGTESFYCGMARGFDLTAAEIVLNYKQEYGLKLTACIPFEGQGEGMPKADRQRYFEILSKCDEKEVFSPRYSYNCMYARNRFLVENCDVLVSYLRKENGGTFYTVNYAKACGKKIIEV